MNYRAFSAGAVLLSAAVSHASITFFDIFRVENFTQTSDSQPTMPDANGFFWNARIFSDTPGELSTGTWTDGYGAAHAMSLDSTGQVLQYGVGGYSDDASMVADILPSSSSSANLQYEYDSSGGQVTASLVEPAAAKYADTVPYLTNYSYSALQNAQAGQDASVSWTPFGSTAGIQYTFFEVYDNTKNVFILSNSGNANSYLGDTIAGADLIAGDTYTYTLFFSSRDSQVGAGFGGATASEGWDIDTSGSFTVAPEPAPCLALALGLGFVSLRRKRSA